MRIVNKLSVNYVCGVWWCVVCGGVWYVVCFIVPLVRFMTLSSCQQYVVTMQQHLEGLRYTLT